MASTIKRLDEEPVTERDPVRIVSAFGCVLLARILFEPVAHAYYLAPGIVLLLIAERRITRIVTEASIAGALLLAFPFHPDRFAWWGVVYALTAALLWRSAW